MKTTLAFWLALVGILPAAEQDWTAWQWEAPVDVRKMGMAQLELPPAVLDSSRPDLGDLRLLSPTGTECGYLVDLPRQQEANRLDASGFKVFLAGTTTVIEVAPKTAAAIEAVELVSPAREFLKAVSIEGRMGDGEWQSLATHEVIFRQAAGAERLQLPLAVGGWDGLRFTLNDDRSPPVPFTGVRLITASEKPVTVESAVTVTAQEELPNETRLTIDLGARNLNIAEIRLEITDPIFSRTCDLSISTPTTEGGIRMESVARGVLYRVVGERDLSAEQRVIPVRRRLPSRYLVAIFRNGDSPPLTITGAAVRCYPTALTFHAAQAGTYRLLTGNRDAPSPDYDLNSLRGAVAAASAHHLTPGPLQARADFKIPPALPGVESPGASIDLADWTRRRSVDAAPSGVVQIELDAWVLAGAQLGLGDLRLIQNGRQIPYLIKPTPVTRDLTPTMVQLPTDPKQPTISRWELKLPVDGLPAQVLTASSPTSMFVRRFEAFVERKDELGNAWTQSIGAAEWTKSLTQDRPLALPLRQQRLPATFHLQTDHGDNPPIPLVSPQLRYAAPVIVAKLATDAPLFLVYGNPKAAAPQYDLRLVQTALMAAEPKSATLGTEEILGPNKPGKRMLDAGSPWLWLALGGVVVALLVVVAKLLPQPTTA